MGAGHELERDRDVFSGLMMRVKFAGAASIWAVLLSAQNGHFVGCSQGSSEQDDEAGETVILWNGHEKHHH